MDLLERDRFLGVLNGLYRDAINGQGRIAAISAEAGGGKTSLVTSFARSLRGRAVTLVGACDPLSTPRPLGPLLDISPRLSPELHHLARSGVARHRVFQAFLDTLARDGRPKLLVFEDLHWADEATLDLILFAGRRLDGVRALLVITFREDEIGTDDGLRVVLGDLASSGVVRRIELPPLTPEAVRVLAQGSGVDPLVLHRQTGGNPFFVTEILASHEAAIPPTVRDAVLARLARLSPESRAYIESAAVVGPAGSRDLVAEISRLGSRHESEVEGAGWLRFDAEGYSFRHELVRDAVMSALPLARRSELSRRCLSVLETYHPGPDDLATLAHHAEEAGDRSAVLRYAPEAARRASSMGAHRQAAAQYARALRWARGDMPAAQRAELLRQFAIESRWTNRLPDAINALREALEIWRKLDDPVRQGEILSEFAYCLVVSGRNVEADAASREAIASLETAPPGPALARAYQIQAHLRMLDRDNQQAVAIGRTAIDLAEQYGAVQTLLAAQNTVGTAQMMSRERAGVELLERTVQQARKAGLDEAAIHAMSNLGSGLGELYELDDAIHWLEQVVILAGLRDFDFHRTYGHAWLALALVYRGDWNRAVAEALKVLGLYQPAPIAVIVAKVALGRVRARQGDAAAWHALDVALGLANQTGALQRVAPVRCARAEAAWLAGDMDATRGEAREVYATAVAHEHPWFAGELAYWQWKTGDEIFIPDFAAEPYALQMSGQWSAAAARWDELGCPYERARALVESADEAALREALTVFDALGARPMSARAARKLRDLGASNIPRGPRPSTRANPAGLTRRQVEVLSLVAQGLSNAEIADRMFLSTKTVEHHVSAILQKLGARTRAEAAVTANRLDLDFQARGLNGPN
jgi:DNA-binding CsgD family transcriptional regulator